MTKYGIIQIDKKCQTVISIKIRFNFVSKKLCQGHFYDFLGLH